MEHTLNTLYCPECGGTNVQIMAWVDANTNKYCSDVNTPAEIEDTWCNDCEDHTGLVTLPELWERFSEIPINNDDEIEKPFLCFPAGAYRFDVWHWFDKRCPNNLHDDLLYYKSESTNSDWQDDLLRANTELQNFDATLDVEKSATEDDLYTVFIQHTTFRDGHKFNTYVEAYADGYESELTELIMEALSYIKNN